MVATLNSTRTDLLAAPLPAIAADTDRATSPLPGERRAGRRDLRLRKPHHPQQSLSATSHPSAPLLLAHVQFYPLRFCWLVAGERE